MADRRSQMYSQAAMIARKKAEIEAKKITGISPKPPNPTIPSPTSFNKNPIHNPVASKNKGLLGHQKVPSSPVQKSISSQPNQQTLKNTFSNDGSFLDQFRKMSEAKKPASTSAPVKVEPSARVEPSVIVEPSVKVEPTISSLPPTVPDPVVEKPPEADEWYKSALERARIIAQNLKQGGPPVVNVQSEVSPPGDESGKIKKEETDESEYGSTTSVPSTSSNAQGPSEEKKDSVKKEEISDMDHDIEPLPIVVQELASMVAVSGDQLEDIARARNIGEEQLAFLQDVDCDIYRRYRQAVESMRKGMDAERQVNKDEKTKERKRSRWSDEQVALPQTMPGLPFGVSVPSNVPPGTSPQLIQYAIRVFGSTDLSEDQWRQCEDQIKMSVVYNEMLQKKKQLEKMEQQGKRKYEYDSDEDVEGGTWEHKARRLEMEKTLNEATKLTEEGHGKHHIGDFLPPEELTKFMAKFLALKRGEEFDESDYQDKKLTQENLGFKMLQKMGWNEGTGLGTEAQGITAPIGKGSVSSDKKGLGVTIPHDLGKDDDEYDAYRKRMMLAYRFRPNPLNNPRRAYY